LLSAADISKIFWIRAGLGVVGGTLSELLTGCKVIIPPPASGGACVGGATPDYSTGLILGMFLFIASYYVLKATIGKKFAKEEQRKVYTTGVGSFAMLFVFSWVLLFTLGVTYLNL
jgi:4-hydroxybenzoate polyprenyltransferase